MRRPVTLLACLALVAFVAGAAPAHAHPHAWIDLSVAIRFDTDGRVTGLHQTWLLDPLYTAYAIQGRDGDGDGQPDPERLRELLDLNLSNLADYDWFSRVWRDGEPVGLKPPREAETRMVGDRLEMAFFLPLAEPASPSEAALTYAVFDPTYYIEVLHAETDALVSLDGAPAGCATDIAAPNPTADAVSLAASLDRTQSAGDGLGILFAEKVALRCD